MRSVSVFVVTLVTFVTCLAQSPSVEWIFSDAAGAGDYNAAGYALKIDPAGRPITTGRDALGRAFLYRLSHGGAILHGPVYESAGGEFESGDQISFSPVGNLYVAFRLTNSQQGAVYRVAPYDSNLIKVQQANANPGGIGNSSNIYGLAVDPTGIAYLAANSVSGASDHNAMFAAIDVVNGKSAFLLDGNLPASSAANVILEDEGGSYKGVFPGFVSDVGIVRSYRYDPSIEALLAAESASEQLTYNFFWADVAKFGNYYAVVGHYKIAQFEFVSAAKVYDRSFNEVASFVAADDSFFHAVEASGENGFVVAGEVGEVGNSAGACAHFSYDTQTGLTLNWLTTVSTSTGFDKATCVRRNTAGTFTLIGNGGTGIGGRDSFIARISPDGQLIGVATLNLRQVASSSDPVYQSRTSFELDKVGNAFLPGAEVSDNLEFTPVTVKIAPGVAAQPDSVQVSRGIPAQGNTLTQLLTSNDTRYAITQQQPPSPAKPNVRLEMTGTAPWSSIAELSIRVEASSNATPNNPVELQVELYDFTAQNWVLIDQGRLRSFDAIHGGVTRANPSRFVQPGTRLMRVRLSAFDRDGASNPGWQLRLDEVRWHLNQI